MKYFDSLHAAIAMVEDLELISYDKEHGKVIELNHKQPKVKVGSDLLPAH